MSYVSVLWDDPPSVSHVHKSHIIGTVVVNEKRLVVWGKEQLLAKIIKTGKQITVPEIVLFMLLHW